MRIAIFIPVLGLLACSGNEPKSVTEPLVCGAGQTAIYTNRFAPQAGSSGVATGADAVAGAINSESGGSTGGSDGVSVTGGAPTTGAEEPTTTGSTGPSTPTPSSSAPLTAMTAACGPTTCAPGQVAVEVPPTPVSDSGGGGVATSATDEGAPTATTSPAVQIAPAGTTVCVAPPPTCAAGLSPQYTSKGAWACTDCALVVTYGGQYGNYRRCVDKPDVVCDSGEVPTWVFGDEAWECQTTCDNGQYDQHTIDDTLVCVPC